MALTEKWDLLRASKEEAAYMLIGQPIGEGCYRKVYQHAMNPKAVVKVEEDAGKFSNVTEWELWREVMDYPKLNRWLAPCLWISPKGMILIQAKTTPCSHNDLPDKVPSFFTDLKRENWGWCEGRLVCHDYGNILLTAGSKLKKAKW
jgi:hypothetical protein